MAMIIAGLIIAACLMIVLSTALQRAVLIMLQAGLLVLALWAFTDMWREHAALNREGAQHALPRHD